MSSEAMADETPIPAKEKRSKDKSEKKKTKKRKHEEQSQLQDTPADAAEDATTSTKPSKKRRRSEKEEEVEAEGITIEVPDATSQTTTTTSIFSPALLDSHSPFVQTTTSLLLPLAPQANFYPIQGLCAEHISPLLLTYYPPLDGILLSYASPRLSQSPTDPAFTSPEADPQPLVLARTADEYAAPFIWLTADFTLLRPKRGTYMAGAVRVQNPSWLGLVCWNYFNAGIAARRLPADWSWVEDDATEGYWADGAGEKVTGTIVFRVIDFDSAPTTERERGFVSFEGSLLGEERDAEVDKEEKAERKARKGKRKGRE